MTKTRRIPARLKKRLQDNLQNLTVKEAGRLLLIYRHEADKKNVVVVEYPPLVELWDAWKLRVSKSRGKEEEPATVAAFNGLVFLQNLVGEVNEAALAYNAQLKLNAFRASTQLDRIITLDVVSEVARHIREIVFYEFPQPISFDDYRRLLAWAEEDALVDLGEEVPFIVEEWARRQSFTKIVIPSEYIRAKYFETSPSEILPARIEASLHRLVSDNDFRREWAEANNLLETFGGDEDRLEEWIQSNEHIDHYVEFSASDYDAKLDEVFDGLVALLETGKLEGGDGVTFDDMPVLLREGKFPAPFALRAVWPQWVNAQGLRIKERRPDPIAPNGIGKVYDPFRGKELDRPALVKLVGQFLKDCKGQKWGGGLLQSQMKPEPLVDILIQEDNPLLYLDIDKPDWGMIDFETFAAVEKTRFGRDYEVGPVATIGSLKRAGVAPEDYDFTGTSYYQERYFPTKDPKARRRDLDRLDSMIAPIEATDRTFVYGDKDAKNPLATIIGAKMATPLERAVAFLQAGFDAYATLRAALALISTHYFDGLPILIGEQEEGLQAVEELLEAAKVDLQVWLDRLAVEPWDVDITTISLREAKADEERAKDFAEGFVDMAKISARTTDRELAKVGLSFND